MLMGLAPFMFCVKVFIDVLRFDAEESVKPLHPTQDDGRADSVCRDGDSWAGASTRAIECSTMEQLPSPCPDGAVKPQGQPLAAPTKDIIDPRAARPPFPHSPDRPDRSTTISSLPVAQVHEVREADTIVVDDGFRSKPALTLRSESFGDHRDRPRRRRRRRRGNPAKRSS
jgi:hypothetical protein